MPKARNLHCLFFPLFFSQRVVFTAPGTRINSTSDTYLEQYLSVNNLCQSRSRTPRNRRWDHVRRCTANSNRVRVQGKHVVINIFPDPISFPFSWPIFFRPSSSPLRWTDKTVDRWTSMERNASPILRDRTFSSCRVSWWVRPISSPSCLLSSLPHDMENQWRDAPPPPRRLRFWSGGDPHRDPLLHHRPRSHNSAPQQVAPPGPL